MMHKNDCLIGQNAACQRSLRSLNTSFELIKFKISFLNPLNFLGEKNSQKYYLEKKSRRNCFGGFDAQFLRFGEKISEKKSFSEKTINFFALKISNMCPELMKN